MENSLDSFLNSTTLPEIKPWMDNVVYIFINGIPKDCYKYCSASKQGKVQTNQREELANFVRERLKFLAEREYKLWINGRMPYITPRELQLWRLRQFVQYIWFWNLPEDTDLAMIFNETKRKASNLINDFIARFRKTLLFPISLRRLHKILNDHPIRIDIPHKEKQYVLGQIYHVVNKRYLDDCNMLIHELRIRIDPKTSISDSYFFYRDINQIWVDDVVINIIKNNEKIIEQIFDVYPYPEQEHE